MIAPPPPRSPWQAFYGAMHRLRRGWYARSARALPRPVISVGNLHFGGTGKTPVTIALAAHLQAQGLAVAILSRGYRSRGAGIRVVSRGAGPELDARTAGDEPVLMAESLPGVAILVGPDRYAAGLHALEHLTPTPQVFLLDDGFSHLALRRDLDLLLFPAADPFAGGRLLPFGRLREPLASSARADAVLLTGVAPESDASSGTALAEALRAHGFTGPGFTVRAELGPPLDLEGRPLPPQSPAVLAAGIARPQTFFAAARRAGLDVRRELPFADHVEYTPPRLREIESAMTATGARWLVVTAKDLVKLRGMTRSPLASLPLRAVPEPELLTMLDRRLDLSGAR